MNHNHLSCPFSVTLSCVHNIIQNQFSLSTYLSWLHTFCQPPLILFLETSVIPLMFLRSCATKISDGRIFVTENDTCMIHILHSSQNKDVLQHCLCSLPDSDSSIWARITQLVFNILYILTLNLKFKEMMTILRIMTCYS